AITSSRRPFNAQPPWSLAMATRMSVFLSTAGPRGMGPGAGLPGQGAAYPSLQRPGPSLSPSVVRPGGEPFLHPAVHNPLQERPDLVRGGPVAGVVPTVRIVHIRGAAHARVLLQG